MMISGINVASSRSIQIEQILVRGIVDLPEHRALIEPQHVRRAKNDAGAAGDGPPEIVLKRAHHDRELTDEPVQQRQVRSTTSS